VIPRELEKLDLKIEGASSSKMTQRAPEKGVESRIPPKRGRVPALSKLVFKKISPHDLCSGQEKGNEGNRGRLYPV